MTMTSMLQAACRFGCSIFSTALGMSQDIWRSWQRGRCRYDQRDRRASLLGLGRMSHFDGASALKLSSWYVGNAEAHESNRPLLCVSQQRSVLGRLAPSDFVMPLDLGASVRDSGGPHLPWPGLHDMHTFPICRSHEQKNACCQDGALFARARALDVWPTCFLLLPGFSVTTLQDVKSIDHR